VVDLVMVWPTEHAHGPGRSSAAAGISYRSFGALQLRKSLIENRAMLLLLLLQREKER